MKRLQILGVNVDSVTIDDLQQKIYNAINQNTKIIIANHNLHSVYLHRIDKIMQTFYEKADTIHIDGMPLVYWGKILGFSLIRDNRITYVDWVKRIIEEADKNSWRIFYIGGEPGVASIAAKKICETNQQISIRTHHGFFDFHGVENELIIEEINNFGPHILMVGMGMPRQEHWILENVDKVSANVILPSGACFDYIAGKIITPPRWLGRIGFEWLYRLITEPKRLWKRYLVEPWALLSLALKDITHSKIN